ncbi:hypothetical protein GWK47_021109 [Chionoecetes opilio]|uniref:Uncharacterized protein n=1 Tax=Chionoecetes opilio TaxID=41210 RepID=A0A8J5CH02_CHIOP|nr:hypothetical protein GWK47_021109 [Chionoecetes opilio]
MAAIWVAFGTGKNFMYLDINAICPALEEIGQRDCLCSTVSRGATQLRFLRQREEISMGGLECLRGGDGGLQKLMNHPYMTVTVNCKQFQLLERFTVIIYNKTSNLDSVKRHVGNSSHRRTGQWKRFPNARNPSAAHTARSFTKLGKLGNQ